MIAWMLFSALVATVLALTVRAAEWLARPMGLGGRWFWLSGIGMTLVVSGIALARPSEARRDTVIPRVSEIAPRATNELPEHRGLRGRIETVSDGIEKSTSYLFAMVRRQVPASANRYAAVVAIIASAALTLTLMAVGIKLRRARRGWPIMPLHGARVRISPYVGPVVIGLVRPEIVIPRWLLERNQEEQSLVVAHEREHVRAKDPLWLFFAWMAVVVAPWNPALWYMAARLRLAIELDCDARVLRQGVAPRLYGALLIDVAQRASMLRVSALALADRSSHLRRRILAMHPATARFRIVRVVLTLTVASVGGLIACQSTLPTDAEIERMDASSAMIAAQRLAPTSQTDTTVVFTVDGSPVTVSEARAVPAEKIATIDFVKAGGERKRARMNITTKQTVEGATESIVSAPMSARGVELASPVSEPSSLAGRSNASFTGLVFIDGARASAAQMKALDPKRIESVEVLKGRAAATIYREPEASNGVIVITTKKDGR